MKKKENKSVFARFHVKIKILKQKNKFSHSNNKKLGQRSNKTQTYCRYNFKCKIKETQNEHKSTRKIDAAEIAHQFHLTEC